MSEFVLRNIIQKMISEIKRNSMPQISQKDLPKAISYIKKHINVTLGVTRVGDLQPMQSNIIKDKIQSITSDLKETPPKDWPPIIHSEDNVIIDGHHRWMSFKILYGEDMDIPRYTIHTNKTKALKIFNEAEGSI